jgi:hypothetical protein
VIDTSHGFARTWLWYLRDYPNMQLEDLRRPFAIPPGAIVLADARNRPRVTDTQASVSITYVNSFAFPVKRYDGLSSADIAERLVSGDSWSTWGRYLRDRESIGTLQTYDGVAWFPLELSVALPMRRAADVLAAEVTPESR